MTLPDVFNAYLIASPTDDNGCSEVGEPGGEPERCTRRQAVQRHYSLLLAVHEECQVGEAVMQNKVMEQAPALAGCSCAHIEYGDNGARGGGILKLQYAGDGVEVNVVHEAACRGDLRNEIACRAVKIE